MNGFRWVCMDFHGRGEVQGAQGGTKTRQTESKMVVHGFFATL